MKKVPLRSMRGGTFLLFFANLKLRHRGNEAWGTMIAERIDKDSVICYNFYKRDYL